MIPMYIPNSVFFPHIPLIFLVTLWNSIFKVIENMWNEWKTLVKNFGNTVIQNFTNMCNTKQLIYHERSQPIQAVGNQSFRLEYNSFNFSSHKLLEYFKFKKKNQSENATQLKRTLI